MQGSWKVVCVHEYRRFVQSELDNRGWQPADLVRRSGLHRQLIWKILHDDRATLGQMPDDTTLEGIARGFGVPVEKVRTAAARSLSGYNDDGAPLTTDLSGVSLDVLLNEIRNRVTGLDRVVVADEPKRPRRPIISRRAPSKGAGVRGDQNGDQSHQLGSG